MSVPKVLVIGAVQGQLEKAFQKIAKLHVKQNFSLAIIVGDLFAAESTDETEAQVKSLLDGSIKVPLPTYFTLGDHSIPQIVQDRLEANGEVCTNLFYLGRKGTLKTTEGIRIVNLGGRLIQNEASLTQAIGKYDPLYTEADSRSLHGAHSADILITNQWPANITKNSQVPIPDSIDAGSGIQCVANLCLALKPRYHFSSSPSAAWSREPFMSPPSVEGRQIKSYEDLDGPVRFSSLASITSSNKECLSAFNLDPTTPPAKDGAQQTCPLTSSTASKRKRDVNEDGGGGNKNYRYSNDQSHDHRSRRQHNNNNKRRHKDPASCFMCASNPTFDDKMLVSIAEDSMLTVLKGPLPIRGTTFPQLKSSGHIMIIPMYHAADEASHGQRSIEDTRREFDEMTQYRHSLQRMLGSKGLGAVCWEVNRTGIRHFHWQLVACDAGLVKSGMVEAAYKVAAEGYKIRSQDEQGAQIEQSIKFTGCEPDMLIPEQRSDFFRVWIWWPTANNIGTNGNEKENENVNSTNDANTGTSTNGGDGGDTNDGTDHEVRSNPIAQADAISNGQETTSTKLPQIQGREKSMFFAIPSTMSFDISFGRSVMAGIMKLEERSDWRTLQTGIGFEDVDAEMWQDDYQRPNGPDHPGWDFAMS